MKDEVAAAVVFLTRLVKRNKRLSKDQYDQFSDKLTALMVNKFKNHWHPERPHKGQAYRCIRINEFEPVDPILSQAASESGLVFSDLRLPCELTLWIDPTEVCCRFGETKSTFCTVASFKEEQTDNQALTLDLEEMIQDYNKKRQEELNKLHEFTGNRSPLNLPGMHHNGGGSSSGYYNKGGVQPFHGNMNFHHPPPPMHHHNHQHHHHHNKWKQQHAQPQHTYMNGRSKVFNGLHVFHQHGDFYSNGLQQQSAHSSSDEESSGNGYQQNNGGGATTVFQAAVDNNAYVDSTSTASGSNNNKVVISSSSPSTQSIHVTSSSAATPINMKTGHSNHISQPSSSTTTQSNKPDRYRWVKGAEPVKA